MSKLTAIDFETANYARASACSVGVVVIEGAEIVERKHYLIKPIGGHVPFLTAIHGITEEQTASAPTFRDLFPELHVFFSYGIIGYTQFDDQVLRALIKVHNLQASYEYEDVCSLAKSSLCDLPNHKLPTVAKHLRIPLENHHCALDDAEACARIYLSLTSSVITSKKVRRGKFLAPVRPALCHPSKLLREATS